MVRLSKAVLARQIRSEVHYPDDGDTLGIMVERYGPGAYLDIVYDYSDVTVRIITNREETDDEYNARIEAHRVALQAETDRKKKAKAKKEAEERALYEKLREKYGE
ncbi:MAG: hypothetical protein M0R77_18425 [Gammaproteobacteria bacterium]|nr:hypothetical protein [Gammaproteobacteria bacterium]